MASEFFCVLIPTYTPFTRMCTEHGARVPREPERDAREVGPGGADRERSFSFCLEC